MVYVIGFGERGRGQSKYHEEWFMILALAAGVGPEQVT